MQRGRYLNLHPSHRPCMEDGWQVGEGEEEACGEALVTARAGGDPKDEVRSKAGSKSDQTRGILPEERNVSGWAPPKGAPTTCIPPKQEVTGGRLGAGQRLTVQGN